MQTKQSNNRERPSFKNSFITVVCICILMTICCIVFGQAMASTHMEPHYALAELQIIVAIIITVILTVIFVVDHLRKHTFKNHLQKLKWYSIPIMLAAVAPLYILIVSQFDCCRGG